MNLFSETTKAKFKYLDFEYLKQQLGNHNNQCAIQLISTFTYIHYHIYWMHKSHFKNKYNEVSNLHLLRGEMQSSFTNHTSE